MHWGGRDGLFHRAADEIDRLRLLLERVLEANIAQGCQPAHPRIQLIYDIQEALNV